MATKKQHTFESIMKMKEDAFFDFVVKEGKAAEFDEILSRTVKHKKYPKVQKPMKQTKKNREDGTYNPDKMTWQADKTKKPVIENRPITFFEAKTAFAKEVLGLKKKEVAAKETFRERFAAKAQNT